jgi:hypothetical protein
MKLMTPKTANVNGTTLSREFAAKIKTAPLPQCAYAAIVGINPAQLSRWVRGREPVRHMEKRCVRIGALLGLEPAECFGLSADQSDRSALANAERTARVNERVAP